MKYLKVFTDFSELLEPLNEEEVGRLFRAMLAYTEHDIIPVLEGNERFVWARAKQIIDMERATCEKRAMNGSKGGQANSSKSKQTVANSSKDKQNEAKSSKEKQTVAEKENENEKEKEKENTSSDDDVSTPTFEQVSEFCKNRGNKTEPRRFFDYYKRRNWKINGQSFNWRDKCIEWESNEVARKPNGDNFDSHVIRTDDIQDIIVNLGW